MRLYGQRLAQMTAVHVFKQNMVPVISTAPTCSSLSDNTLSINLGIYPSGSSFPLLTALTLLNLVLLHSLYRMPDKQGMPFRGYFIYFLEDIRYTF